MNEKSSRTRKLLSILGLFLVAMIWGSTFTANKIVLRELTPFGLMTARFNLAFVFMYIFFSKKFKGIKLHQLKGGVYCGISLFAGFLLQIYGLLYTDAGKQAFLSGSYVVAVPFLVWWFLKVKPQPKVYAGVIICFAGISLLSIKPDFSIALGDSLTLMSSFFFAAQIVIAGHYVKHEDAAVLSTIQFGTMGILSLICTFILGDYSIFTLTQSVEPVTVLSLVYLGIVGTAAAYYMQIHFQKNVSATTTSIILSFETVFGMLLAVIILGEVFTYKMLIGAVLIFISIFITEA